MNPLKFIKQNQLASVGEVAEQLEKRDQKRAFLKLVSSVVVGVVFGAIGVGAMFVLGETEGATKAIGLLGGAGLTLAGMYNAAYGATEYRYDNLEKTFYRPDEYQKGLKREAMVLMNANGEDFEKK